MTNHKQLHIVCGDSIRGSVTMALKSMKRSEKVISLHDTFSSGPVLDLHKKSGIEQRYQWLEKHFRYEYENIHQMKDHFNHAVIEIKSIPKDISIVIWVGDNAHEQTGLRFVLYLLKGKSNDISVIHTTSAYVKHCQRPHIKETLKYSGEISSDQFKVIYEDHESIQFLTSQIRETYESEWEALASSEATLRIWKDGQVQPVGEDYFDDFMVQKAYEVQAEKFILVVRLIGEIIGYLHDDEYVGDRFIEYRIRQLIHNGTFLAKGDLTCMKLYKIKINRAL